MRLEALLLACCALIGVYSAPGEGSESDEAVNNKELRDKALALTSDWPDSPPYVESLELLARNGKALKELLPHEALKVTDPRRHYVLIAGVLACVVEYLNSDCTPPDYDHEYLPAVDILLPVVWQDPRAAVAKLERFVEDSNDTLESIQEIVDIHCVGLKANICNRVLQAIVSQSDEYDNALELLILVGQLAEIYEKNRYADEAAKFNAVGLLLTGQEMLKPLVFKAAEVYNKIYGRHCEP